MTSDTPRLILACGALVEGHDTFTGKPAGDYVRVADYERDLAAANAKVEEYKRDAENWRTHLETMKLASQQFATIDAAREKGTK